MSQAKPQTNEFVRTCRQRLGAYYLAANPSYHYVPFQQEIIIPALEQVARKEIDKLMLWVPPGHGKSNVVSKTFIPWYLGGHPRDSVILICYGDDLAKDFGDSVKNMVASDFHKMVFPECKLSPSSRAKDFFKTTLDGAFYAVPFDGAVSGKRADCLLIDDPLKNVDEALSETRENHLMSLYRAIIKTRLKPGGRIILVTTRLALRDFSARILEEEGAIWKVIVLQAEPEPGRYLWEEHFGRERYEEAKHDSYTWNALYQQSPVAPITQPFNPDWLDPAKGGSIYTHVIRPNQFNNYVIVDPALSKASTADRTCILVFAAGPERKVFLIDAVLDRLDPGERTIELLRLARVYKPRRIVYEEYGLLSDTYFIKQEMQRQDLTIYPVPVGRAGPRHRMSKQERIMELVPDFREGRIWLPPTLKRKLRDGTTLDIVRYFVEQEYLPWAGDGSVPHDDMLDAMSRLHEPELYLEHVMPATGDEDDNSNPLPAGATWEGRY